MSCDEIREGLSARLDGEPAGRPAGVLDAHLAHCPACADWLARAQRVTRLVRVRPADVPDLTAGILAAVAADPRAGAARPAALPGGRQVLRLAVALAALGQFVVALPVLLGGVSITEDLHTSREMASFDIALAVGFALAAWRPHRVRAVLPVALVLAVCLAATSLVDVVRAQAQPWQEIGHLATVVQALLLWGLGRADGRRPAAGGLRPA